MKKGRRYKSKEERDRALKFRSKRNIRGEMYQKTLDRSDTRTVRNNSFFSLVYNKRDNEYILTDLREGKSVILSKQVVKDEELAMTDNDNFNDLSRKILSNNK